ncbi:MAG: VWA domain-containing protein [Candidatus Binatia bacterium]
MLWGFPYALLLLLGAVPLIIFLNSLRPKGLRLRTTTYFIWERVLRERPLGTRLGWLLRKNLLLILQILAALILIAALADPSLFYFGAPAGDTVVVIDLSASMKAKAGSATRFESARRQFLSIVDEMPSGRRMMVVGAGPQPRVLAPFTADKRRLEELGRTLAPTDAPARVKEAVLFAHAFLKKGSPDRVVVITDGSFDGAGDFTWRSAHLRLVPIEGGNENVGIIAFEVRRRPSQPSELQILAHVRNFTAKPVRAPLTLTLAGKTLTREPIEVEPDGRRVLIFPYEGPAEGLLEARLDVDDDFATDNRAYLALSESPPVHVLYVGPGNPFLNNLLRFFPGVRVTHAERWEADGAAAGPYDVVIFDRVPPPALARGNFILINTIAPNLPLAVNGKLERPRVLSPLLKHPLTAGLQLGDLYVQEALRLVSKDGETLARTAGGPLLWALEKGNLRVLLIGFDLLSSDLPVRVAFPLLFHNAIEWFQPSRLEFPAKAARAGEPYALSTQEHEVQLTTPSGKKETLKVASDPLMFAGTFEAGFYTYRTQSRAGRFAVNLFDETESQIRSRISAGREEARPDIPREAANSERGMSLWPYLLLAVLGLLGAEAFLAFRAGAPWAPLAFRLAAFAALIVALVNPRIMQSTRLLDVIVGVDFSRSVGREGIEKARQLLEAASRLKNPDARTGLLFFGRRPVWEFPPRADFPVVDVSPRTEREESDIEAALQAAVAQFGEGRQKKLILISDGNENRGESMRVVPLLRAQGVQVSTLPVTLARGKNELYVSDLALPQQVDSAESFEMRAAIESLAAANARIKLLRDGVVQREQELRLNPGTNRLSFRESLRERGNHKFELLVESAEDTLPENNLLQGVVEVKGPPRILYLSSRKQSALSRALQVQGYSVVESSPEHHPLTVPEISSFDLLVLDNVPAYQFSQAKMEAIEKYVRDHGGGLLVIGGEQSYGAGGYYRTPFERILPLDMRPPARLDLPHVALLFVIDKSGSMGGGGEGNSKLDLAKSAALAAADIMNPTDQVGVLGFDAGWDWVLPFRPVGKGEWIAERLAGLQSDGGTDLYKALVEAHRVIASKQASIKHVLVLSDGLTDKMDFHSLVTKMARNGITVSTVAVGGDADFKLMDEIAKDGKGRGYVTLDPQTIPQIFTTETLLISRDLLVEKMTAAKVVAAVGPLKGFSRVNLPALRGYVLTYPKPSAEVLMKAGDDPLLASWRYGLGRVIAFTSDLSGRWGGEWVSWEGFPLWASQLARATMRQLSENRLRTEFQPEGDRVKVVADILSGDGDFVNQLTLRGNLTAPDKSTEEKTFRQIAPGRYEGDFSGTQRGINLLTLFAGAAPGKEPLAIATLPYIAPYPKEYRELKPNTALLSRLAEETGGEMLDPNLIEEGVKRLYTPAPEKGLRGQETWWHLSGIGLFIFLADLVLRIWPRRQLGSALG